MNRWFHEPVGRFHGLAIFVLLALTSAGRAATVTYSSYVAANAADTAWASPTETVPLSAINFGGSATTFAGVNWSAGSTGSWPCGNDGIAPYLNFSQPGVAWGNNETATFYGGAGPSLLDDAAWLGSSSGVIAIGGFTVGKCYLIQFVLADGRGGSSGRTITIQGSGGTIAGQNSAAVQYAYGDGRYAVVSALLVADATSYNFAPLVNGGSGGTQINGVRVYQVTDKTLTYDGNGSNSGTAPTDGSSPYVRGSTVTVLGNTGALTKSGLNFAGWNTAADGSGTTYTAGSTFAITSNTVLYARWISGYAVTYDPNGGVNPPVDTNSYNSGATVTVKAAGALARPLATFSNWNTAANGSGVSFSAGNTFNIASNTTLYARWTPILAGQTVTWTAGVNSNWDQTTANWTNSLGVSLWTNSSTAPYSAVFGSTGSGFVNVSSLGTLYASNLTFNSTGYVIGGGTLTLGNPPVIAANADVLIGAALAGTNSVVKTGAGTLTLTNNANSYTGPTTIGGGTLAISGAGRLNSGNYSGNITNNGTFSYNGTALQSLGGVISGAGALTQGAGTLTLNGANTFTGNITVNSGTLRANASAGTLNPTASTLGNGQVARTITINNGGTLLLNAANVLGTQLSSPQVNWVINAGGLLSQSTTANRQNVLGAALTLNGGSIAVGSGSSAQYCALALSGMSPSVTVGGSQASYITNAPSVSNAGLALGTWNGVTTFNVADATGNSNPDLIVGTTLQNAISTDGSSTNQGVSCLVKTGAGTMKVTGTIQSTGFITIYDGTLDLSSATVVAGTKINLVGLTAVLIPPTAGTTNITLYLNNQKLAAGTWGAPGSSAQNTSVQLGGTGLLTQDNVPSRRDIWKTLKYGIFSHYTWWGYAGGGTPDTNGVYPQSADDVANKFNAPQYASDVAQAGAQYVVFTAWHSNFRPLWPSPAWTRYAGGGCPTRDAISDMIDACKARGLRVYLYTHPYQPLTGDLTLHNNWINDVYAEVVDRYGSRIDGLWIDENQVNGDQDSLVDYKRLLKTIHQRNPDLVTMQNGGQIYTVDMGGPEVVNNWNFGWSECMYNLLNAGSGPGVEDMVRTLVLEAASNFEGGGVHWSIDGVGLGGLSDTSRVFPCGRYLAPIMISITNTHPSTAFPPPYHNGRTIGLSDSNWFATDSGDNTKTFIHVLTAPSSNTLTLPAPADGKIFTNASLLASLQVGAPTQQVLNAAVTLLQTPRGLQLTLTGTNTWIALDTVIQLDVASPGGTGMVNDASPSVTYTGNSWSYQAHRGLGEYADDAHTATANGDAFTFTFSGTEVSLITSRGANRGGVDLYIDDVLQTNVNLSVGNTNRDVVFTKSGLPRGTHTLKGVKTSGTSLVVDAFRIIEMVNDSDPDLGGSFPSTLSLGSGAAGYSGSGWQPGYNGVGWLTPNIAYEPSRSLTDTNPPASPYFTFGFTGTGAQCFLSSAFSWAYFFITVDGVFQTNVQVTAGSVSTFTVTNLPMGAHTIQGITWKATTDPSQPGVNYFTVTRPDLWIYQTNRNLGEYGNDVHYSDVNGPFNYNFTGSGVDVIVSRDENCRMAWYGVSGMGSSTGARRQNYLESFEAGGSSFGLPNLVPGNYSVTAQNGGNTSGMNFSYVRLNIDALRVYKGESLSSTPFLWGATGAGGSGTWDVNTTANWNDGTLATKWYDFGGLDYAALFQGTAGTVSLATNINVNRLTFNTTGYTLQNKTLNFTGANPALTVASNASVTVASAITGSSGLTVTGPGTLTVTGTNTSAGGITLGNGTLVAARSMQDNGIHTLGTGNLTINSGGTLRTTQNWATGSEWDPAAAVSVGAITLNQGGTWSIEAVGMAVRYGLYLNGGAIIGTTAQADWGALYLRNTSVTVGGNALSSIGVDTALSSITPIAVSAGSQLAYSGNIHNTIGQTGGITKTGAGTLLLNGTNLYTGATTITAGTLGGTGSIKGSVIVQSGAILAPGASLGTLTISNTLTLAAGSQTFVEINAATGTNDLVRGITTVNYGGTLVITNVAGTVSVGQTFKLFSAVNRTGNFSAITPTNPAPGLLWNFNPTNGVLTALATVALNPTNVTASVTGTNLTLTWPADHTGWTLLSQTNNLHLGISASTNDWIRIPGSSATNRVVIPILPTQPGGYYRLVYP